MCFTPEVLGAFRLALWWSRTVLTDLSVYLGFHLHFLCLCLFSVEHWLNQNLLQLHVGADPFSDGCAPLWAWVHMALALNAAATELPPFVSLKNFRGIWILGVNCFSAGGSDITFESRNIDIVMFLLSRLLLGSPHGLSNTISCAVPDPHCLGNLYRCCAALVSL